MGLAALSVLVAGMYVANLARINRDPYAAGPTTHVSRELFDYVSRCTPADARFMSQRPRKLALYTHRAATSGGRVLRDPESMRRFMDENRIDHVVATPDTRYEEYTAGFPQYFDLTFRNDRYSVWRYRADGSETAETGC
jgi:hypothetical protein